MKRVYVIFDDRIRPSVQIRRIIGSKSFGNVILHRMTLFQRWRELSGETPVILLNETEMPDWRGIPDDAAIFHVFSSAAVLNPEEYRLLLQKASFAEEEYHVAVSAAAAGGIFHCKAAWKRLMDEEPEVWELKRRFEKYPEIRSDAFLNLADVQSFLSFLTGGFEARYFNSLDGDDFTVTKHSKNREKISAEYEFYRLLPDPMKPWFVMPYDYREDEKGASYTMERMHMTDLAIRFVHGAVGLEEFENILRSLFRFLSVRDAKEVSAEDYKALQRRIYIDKVRERTADFLSRPEAAAIDAAIASMTAYSGIREIEEKYEALYEGRPDRREEKKALVIGHGDLCFSNILYQPDADIIRFIDPKGCRSIDEAYTDPYYDVAKLSHSVCGGYDLINSAQYQIVVDADLTMKLHLDMETGEFRERFRVYAEQAGYSFSEVRLFECSLFLSMLPLHIDRPQKVLAFILNAIGIMEELNSKEVCR